MNFTRQNRMFDPDKCNKNILIIGAGSTGSFLALTLAKMGIKDITIIDYDIVEKHNLPNQFYREQDLGKVKVDALCEIIKDFTGVEATGYDAKVTEDYELPIDLNTIVISCVDNMETRRLIFNKLECYGIKFIDTRFGGEGYSIHMVDMNDERDRDKYLDSMELEIKETGCGEKSIIYTILSLASEVCAIMKKIIKEESYPKILKRELKTYRFIGK